MATYIKTLKEDNGDIVYPQTITDAIYTSGGQTLETEISKYVTAEDIASSVAAFGTVTTGMLDDDAVTTTKIDDGAITSAKIDFTTLDFGNFSTSEVDTGMTWVDGKHIYKRVFAANFTTPAVGTRLAIDLIASNIDNVIRVCGNFSPNNSSITTGEHYAFGGGALGSNVDAEISIRTNSNKLQLLVDNYANAYVGKTGSYSLSVEYTKVS